MVRKITKEQQKALLRIYLRQLNDDNGPRYKSYRVMRKAVSQYFDGSGCIMIEMRRVFIGIEKDGYTHT